MIIPEAWAGLEPDAKRERLLAAAETLFARDGLDATMPAIAAEAGAGVGSLYRQFDSKDDLIGALALKRLAHIDTELDAALGGDGSWGRLEAFFSRVLEPYAADDLVANAIASAAGDTEVVASRDAVTSKMQRFLDATDPGLTTQDVTLVFIAARAARAHDPETWRRMVTLVLAGLRAVNVR